MQSGIDNKEKRPAPQPPPIPAALVAQNDSETPPSSPTKSVTPPTSSAIQDIPLPQIENTEGLTDSPDNEKVLNVMDIKRALECQLNKR